MKKRDWDISSQRSWGQVSLPDEEQDAEAPWVHCQAVACGGGLGEDLGGQVRRRATQGPHQHGLLQDAWLVKICNLAPPRRVVIGQYWSEEDVGRSSELFVYLDEADVIVRRQQDVLWLQVSVDDPV